MIDLTELRRVCEGATDGPWTAHDEPTNTDAVLVFCALGFPVCNMSVVWNRPVQLRLADAAFVALARTALPACIAEIEALRNALGSEVALSHKYVTEVDSLRQQLHDARSALHASELARTKAEGESRFQWRHDVERDTAEQIAAWLEGQSTMFREFVMGESLIADIRAGKWRKEQG